MSRKGATGFEKGDEDGDKVCGPEALQDNYERSAMYYGKQDAFEGMSERAAIQY